MLINNDDERAGGEPEEPEYRIRLNWLFAILAGMVLIGLLIWINIDWGV